MSDKDPGAAPGENKEAELPEGDMGDFEEFIEDYVQDANLQRTAVDTQLPQNEEGGKKEEEAKQVDKNESIEEVIPELKGEKTPEQEELEQEPSLAAATKEEEPPPITTPEETPSAEPTEVSKLLKRIEGLESQSRDQLNENARLQRMGARGVPEESPQPTDQQPQVDKVPKQKVDFQNFVTKEEAEALDDDAHGVLNKVLARVVEAAVDYSSRSIPEVASQTIRAEMEWHREVDKFFEGNPDLAKYADFCAVIADTVTAENPGSSPKQIFDKTAVRARERLGFQAKVEPGPGEEGQEQEVTTTPQETPPGDPPPALPTKGAGRRVRKPAAPTVSDLQTDINDLIDLSDL